MPVFDVPLEVLRQRRSMKWSHYPSSSWAAMADPSAGILPLDILPLWVAEMDCLLSPAVADTIRRAVDIGDFGYHARNILEPAWQRYAAATWDQELERPQLTLCADVMSAMTWCVHYLTPATATIATTTPIYPPFRVAGSYNGRRLLTVDMTEAGRLDLDAIDRLFAAERPAAFLLCNPYNPHGTIATAEELTRLANSANRYGVTVIADEIHALVHDPATSFTPYLSLPEAQRGFVACSASKGFGLASLKAGLLIAGRERVKDLAALPYETRDGATGYLALLAQAAGLDHDREWLGQLNSEIVAHKQLLAGLLPSLSLSYTPSPATYLAWVDATSLGLDQPARFFFDHARVALNPGTDYDQRYGKWIRINLATSPDIITTAVHRLAAALH